MSLNQLLASDRLRPLLEGVLENARPAAVSLAGGNGNTSLDVTPSIRVRDDAIGSDPIRRIVDALIATSVTDGAEPIADTLTFDNQGLYFVGVGSTRGDEFTFVNTRTDQEAPSLFLDARDGDDVINVRSEPPPPPPQDGSDPPRGPVGAAPETRVFAGAGNDRVRIEAAYLSEVDGGDGDDLIATRSVVTDLVSGGDGDDRISAFGRRIGTILAGSGNDTITVSAGSIGLVDGGAGDDNIIAQTRNEPRGGPDQLRREATQVSGGAGDDRILTSGRAEVFYSAGDGNDAVSVGDTTTFNLAGGLSLAAATIEEDGAAIRISFAETGESIDIESRTGFLRLVANDDSSFTLYTSEEGVAAALAEADAGSDPIFTGLPISLREGDGDVTATVDQPTLVNVGESLDLESASFNRDDTGVTITFASGETLRIDAAEGTDLFLAPVNRNSFALFTSPDQVESYRSSSFNPANFGPTGAQDTLLNVILRANEDALFGGRR